MPGLKPKPRPKTQTHTQTQTKPTRSPTNPFKCKQSEGGRLPESQMNLFVHILGLHYWISQLELN